LTIIEDKIEEDEESIELKQKSKIENDRETRNFEQFSKSDEKCHCDKNI